MFSLSLIVVLLVTVLATYVLVPLAPNMSLLAVPGEHRLHHKPTPMVGGMAIYLGVLTGYILVDPSFHWLLSCLFLICMVGVLDDRFSLPSWSRFLAQGLVTYLMITLTGVQLESLGFLLSNDSEVLLGSWSVPMTIFATIGVINAVNMSDGMDGLAAAMVLLVLASLMIFGGPSPSLVLIAMASVLGFLVWNLRFLNHHARAFMGDAGSTMLGLLLAYLLIEASQTKPGIAPVTALWILALPLIDAVTVLIVRPIRGNSPFSADRIHYHHLLLNKGLSVNLTLCILLSVQVLFVLMGLWLAHFNVAENIQLLVFLIVFSIYLLYLLRYTGNKQAKADSQ